MNKSSLSVVFSLCGVFLSSCSITNSITTFTPQTAQPNQAIVYIYRPNEMTNSFYSPGLLINGEFKLYTKNAMNSRLSLVPGEYQFEFQNENKYSELTPLSLILKNGANYFIRVNTSLKINNGTSYEPYTRSFTLTRVDEQQAVKEITECCIHNSKPPNKEKTKPNEKTPNKGFTVDKTQNPFSH